MKIFVTGVRGFLGSALAAHLRAAGHAVAGSTRSPSAANGAPEGPLYRLALGQPPPAEIFAGTELLIHCAYAAGKSEERLNVAGTIRISEAASSAGVRRQLLFSSFSARPDAVSGYGRMKYELEQYFVEQHLEVLRPGLVLGSAGLFASMVRLVRRLPVLPLPDGAVNLVPIVGVPDFLACLDRLLEAPRPAPVNLCCPNQPTLRELLTAIASAEGLPRLFVPFPTKVLIAPLVLLGKLGLGLGVDPDSLRGYTTNVSNDFPSHYGEFFASEPSLSEMVEAALLVGPG